MQFIDLIFRAVTFDQLNQLIKRFVMNENMFPIDWESDISSPRPHPILINFDTTTYKACE